MKSRRLIASPEAYEHWFKLARIADQCLLWVNNRHSAMSASCLLYPDKRTLHRTDRRLIFCREIALNQVGNFQIIAFGSLA
jgi:hypothetical protein